MGCNPWGHRVRHDDVTEQQQLKMKIKKAVPLIIAAITKYETLKEHCCSVVLKEYI